MPWRHISSLVMAMAVDQSDAYHCDYLEVTCTEYKKAYISSNRNNLKPMQSTAELTIDVSSLRVHECLYESY